MASNVGKESMIQTLGGNELLRAVEQEENYIKNRRNIGNMDGLVTGNEYENQPLLKWDVSLPTVLTSKDYFDQGEINWKKTQDTAFIHKKIMNAITEISLDTMISKNINPMDQEYEPGFVLAGGFIHTTMIDRHADTMEFDDSHYIKCDIDCFNIGLDETVAEFNINEWYSNIKANPPYGSNVDIIRTRNTITVVVSYENYKILVQFITKKYRGLASLLHDFDISVAAIALDKTQIYMTELCSMSYRSGVVPVELAKRRSTYELRMQKYLNKWMDLDTNLKFSYIFQQMCDIPSISDKFVFDGTILCYCRLKYISVEMTPHITKNMGLMRDARVSFNGITPIPYDVKRSILCKKSTIQKKNIMKIVNEELPLAYNLAEPNEWTGPELRTRWWVDVGQEQQIFDSFVNRINDLTSRTCKISKQKLYLGKFFNEAIDLLKIEDETERAGAINTLCDKITKYIMSTVDKFNYTKICEKMESAMSRIDIDAKDIHNVVKSVGIENTFRYQERLGWYDDTVDTPFNYVIIPASIWYNERCMM